MSKIRLLFTAALLLLLCTAAQAQFGKLLGKSIEDAAKNATVRKAQQKTDEAVSKTIDKATDTKTYKGDGKGNSNSNSSNEESNQSGDDEATVQTTQKDAKSLEMAYAKSDFVPGDEIIFDDNMNNEQLGEFPSQWDLHRGNAEIASVNGKKVILMDGKDSWIEPLMKTPKNYLGDVFTMEFDFLQPKDDGYGSWELDFMGPNDQLDHDVFTITWYNSENSNGSKDIDYGWTNSSGRGNGVTTIKPTLGDWYHVAVSFNKRALKVYINGVRIANVPNVSYAPGWVTFWSGHGSTGKDNFVKDVRIAKGAVPLYDRMMSDGKFITYGITFDVGKSTIKPESMAEINRIVQLMKDNPDVKFSIEGHTDSTGNATSNQTLSEARSKAIMDKLVELGIAANRLKAVGKGQTSPIADNSTDEGKAKNRRVEFVKI